MKLWVMSYVDAVRLLYNTWKLRRVIHKNTGVWPDLKIEVNGELAAWFPRGDPGMRNVEEHTEK